MMSTRPSHNTRRFSKGLTLIELLVVLAMMAVLLAFAAPSMEGVVARADIKAASENVSHAFRMAKNTARITSNPVTLTFTTGSSGNTVSFDFPGDTAVTVNGLTMPDIQLPDAISIAANPSIFTFDPMGRIIGFSEASSIILSSTVNTSHAATVSIVNEMGYVTIAQGATTEEEES